MLRAAAAVLMAVASAGAVAETDVTDTAATANAVTGAVSAMEPAVSPCAFENNTVSRGRHPKRRVGESRGAAFPASATTHDRCYHRIGRRGWLPASLPALRAAAGDRAVWCCCSPSPRRQP